MYTLEGTVLIQSSWNFVRMFILIKSRPELKICRIESKTGSLGKFLEKLNVKSRSLGQLLEKRAHSGRHSLDPIFMKLFQNVCHYEI